MKRLSFSKPSIRQRLTLLICTLLLSVILIFGLISYLGVRKSAFYVAQERLQSLSKQLSNMLSGNTRNLISAVSAAANKPSVKSYLISGGKDSSTEVAKLLLELQKDSSYVQVQLRNANGTTLLNSSKLGVDIKIPLDTLVAELGKDKLDSGRVGKLYAINDSVFYPIVGSVIHDNRLVGYLVRWRMMQSNSKAFDQLSQLMGSEVKLLIGNSDGSLWTDMHTSVSAPPYKEQGKSRIIEYTRSNTVVLSSTQPIAHSQWLIAVEFPKHKILQTASRFLYWLVVAGLSLLAIGIFFGWLMSRNISGPLVKLTAATSQIADGKYAAPIQVNRTDELGRLARSFNAMQVQVQNSQRQLEQKAEYYKLLFENNPMPMYIVSNWTLNIVDVNRAAINHYGYTREEFLRLNSKDIRPAEDIEKFIASLRDGALRKYKQGIWRHKKKDGTIIMVDLTYDEIVYDSEPARLVLANDITEKLNAEAELVRHRIMQQELITETTIQVQEKEREELAKELHDNINQILASTKLYLELAKGDRKELFPNAIAKSYENINLAISEIRQLSKQLVPPAEDITLTETLKDLIQEIEAITPIKFFLDTLNFHEGLIDENIRLTLYRIVQEQVNNILKYAAASEVTMHLATVEGFVYLKIADNGVGFDPAKKSRGIGLRNIDSRVKFLKGTASVYSEPGEGCSIEVSLPLERKMAVAI